MYRLREQHRIVSKYQVGYTRNDETFYLRFVLHQGLCVVIVSVSDSEVKLFGAWHDSVYGNDIFYQSKDRGMTAYFEYPVDALTSQERETLLQTCIEDLAYHLQSSGMSEERLELKNLVNKVNQERTEPSPEVRNAALKPLLNWLLICTKRLDLTRLYTKVCEYYLTQCLHRSASYTEQLRVGEGCQRAGASRCLEK
jgi:hypothetical protein